MKNANILHSLALDHIEELHRDGNRQRLAGLPDALGQGPPFSPFVRARQTLAAPFRAIGNLIGPRESGV